MKKIMSLIKACMTENMGLFKIKKKDKKKTSGKLLTTILSLIFAISIWSYADMTMDSLVEQHNEPVLLTLFVFMAAVFIIVEGVYKAGGILFNCKDDDLLLSLPIKKSTVVFIRILKFYVFELMYNSLLLVPTMIVYATRTGVNWTYYLVSAVAILLLPIIPIVISCVVGVVISATATKFKYKNIAQIVISMACLLAVLYLSFNMESLMLTFGQNAQIVGNAISRIYYPAYMYTKLVVSFSAVDLISFIAVNFVALVVSIFILSKVYFKINSSLKMVEKTKSNRKYKVKVNKPMWALIKKELKKFINTPVLVTNAIFGLVLFVIMCIIVVIKFDGIVSSLEAQSFPMTSDEIMAYMPVVLFMFIIFGSLTSSITSSMISLEGKSFIILKSLPVKPYTIILSKVATAVLIMMPFILVGDIIFFIKFKFNVVQIIVTLIFSAILPLIAEIIGILVNLKYPKMDGDSDAEVVKQSSSSNISVLIGFLLMLTTIFFTIALVASNCNANVCMYVIAGIYVFIFIFVFRALKKKGVKRFNNIEV